MSHAAVFAVALILAVAVYLADRECRASNEEHEMRMQAEAERDAFESLFIENAKERL